MGLLCPPDSSRSGAVGQLSKGQRLKELVFGEDLRGHSGHAACRAPLGHTGAQGDGTWPRLDTDPLSHHTHLCEVMERESLRGTVDGQDGKGVAPHRGEMSKGCTAGALVRAFPGAMVQKQALQ